MIKAIIIEDEPNGQELLKGLIKNYCEGIDVVGIAASVKQAIEIVNDRKPDLVFLDYQLQGGNGFDILDAFAQPFFKVIFITGYSEFAIKAFKYAALDYILKPINISELQAAVARYNPEVSHYKKSLEFFQESVKNPKEAKNQIILTDRGDYKVLNLNEIAFVKAIQSYVEFYLSEGRKFFSSHSLKHYEDLLPKGEFFKTHKSYIINKNFVKSINQGRGGDVTLTTGHKVPIATRRKTLFLRYLNP